MSRFAARMCFLLVAFVVAPRLPASDPAPSPSKRDALKALGDLAGTWRGTGTPAGSREEQRTGFWTESIEIGWKFKGDDARLVFAFEKSKHFRSAELSYSPAEQLYRLHLDTAERKDLTLEGKLQGRILSLQSSDPDMRVVFSFLHDNRFLYRQEKRSPGRNDYAKTFQVGATKEGVAFATGNGQPECIVTGGLAKTPVTFQGKTYYVCCSGCRDEFLADPERYVREAAAKKKK